MPAEQLPPLTDEQRRLVQAELSLYLAHYYRAQYPYQMPTFRALRRSYHPDHVPDDLAAGQVARSAPHQVGDPTYSAAMVTIYGPRPVVVWVGERIPIPAASFKNASQHLPTHLLLTYEMVIVRGMSFVGAADRLHIGRQTVSTYTDQLIDYFASTLYGDRWTVPQPRQC